MSVNPYQWTLENALGYGNAMGRYKTQREWDFLRKHLPAPPARILDIGGGVGRFALPLARAGYLVTVIDLAAEALERLASYDQPGIELIHGDFVSRDTPGPFDAVIAIEVLPALATVERVRLYDRISGFLVPRGVLVFTAINSRSWRFKLHRMKRGQPALSAARPREYLEALRRTGFDLIEMAGFVWMPFQVHSDSRWVQTFERAERTLRLSSWLNQSPWLLVAARSTGASGYGTSSARAPSSISLR